MCLNADHRAGWNLQKFKISVLYAGLLTKSFMYQLRYNPQMRLMSPQFYLMIVNREHKIFSDETNWGKLLISWQKIVTIWAKVCRSSIVKTVSQHSFVFHAEMKSELRKRKVLWLPGHCIMHMSLSPFPEKWLVASPGVAISV